jgi:RNA polymerase sigma factor (sigma-70 family)
MAPSNAFIEFYERNAETVLLFFTRRTLDAEIALDLTAETFAQAWRGWRKVRLDSPAEVQGWLFTIARRQLSHYLRRGIVERRALRQLGLDVPGLEDEEITEIQSAAGVDALRSTLAEELTKLTEDQRNALQLRIVDELPYPEVARRMGSTEPTARARVSRGLRVLAAALEPVISPDQRSTL